jgi:hypothetical protein
MRDPQSDMMEIDVSLILFLFVPDKYIFFVTTNSNTNKHVSVCCFFIEYDYFYFYLIRHMQHLACRYHPDAELIEDYRAGDIICSQCGLVVGDRYDYFIRRTSEIL